MESTFLAKFQTRSSGYGIEHFGVEVGAVLKKIKKSSPISVPSVGNGSDSGGR